VHLHNTVHAPRKTQKDGDCLASARAQQDSGVINDLLHHRQPSPYHYPLSIIVPIYTLPARKQRPNAHKLERQSPPSSYPFQICGLSILPGAVLARRLLSSSLLATTKAPTECRLPAPSTSSSSRISSTAAKKSPNPPSSVKTSKYRLSVFFSRCLSSVDRSRTCLYGLCSREMPTCQRKVTLEVG